VTTVIVFTYAGFLLAERGHFVHKLTLMVADAEQARAVEAIIDSIARSVHRYVLVKTFVSAVTGLLTYGVVLASDMAFAEMLALSTFLLNFIPNIGSMIAVALVGAVALVQFETWAQILSLLTILGVIQFTIGNILEPLVMGRSLQLSTFVVVLSLMFWGALWGVVGMFLAVPLTVMIMIVCANIPALRPFAILLSRDGGLLTDRA
jgi:predicted PurR-regulated permease PerM